MGQLFLVILILAGVLGIYRCGGTGTDKAQSGPDAVLQAPARIEQDVKRPLDEINRREREMRDRD